MVVKHTKLQPAFGGGDLVKSKPLLKLVNMLVIAIMLLPACLSPVDAYIGNGIGGQDIAIYIGGQKLSFDTPPLNKEGRIFVPIRYIAEYFGGEVEWDPENQIVNVRNGSSFVSLQIGFKFAGVNGAVKVLDVPPFIYSGRTYVPLRFVSEALGKEVRWDDQNRVVYIETGVESYTTTLAVSTGTATVNVVKVSLNDPTIKLEIVNAQDQIGVLEPFESMVERKNPLAAINGTFFQVADTSLPMEPAANLVINGRIEHLGTPEKYASTFAFTQDNQVDIANVKMKLQGEYTYIPNPELERLYTQGWYIGTINRTMWGENSIRVFTPLRGATTGLNVDGINVIVRNGEVVEQVTGTNVPIPPDGYVIHLGGTEVRFKDRFEVGTRLSYRDIYDVRNSSNPEMWQEGVIWGALSAGPRLITNGEITLDPASELLDIPKITGQPLTRSALGITQNNELLMVTVSKCTIQDLATIMKDLGAYNAMNLDGGASTSLYANGKFLATPTRKISNALMVLPR